jgi:hypothetical protein
MDRKYNWLNKKTPRSVDQLRLWDGNPRLNPEENHIQISDFAEDLTFDDSDKKQFFKLIKSIVEDGFIPADPVIVWKNVENEKYYVAEGNRRVLALKLLREPHKAPRSIRAFIRAQSVMWHLLLKMLSGILIKEIALLLCINLGQEFSSKGGSQNYMINIMQISKK